MEIKDVLQAIGFDGETENLTPEALSEWHEKTFIGKKPEIILQDPDIASKLRGKFLGEVDTKLNGAAKSLGIDWAEFKGDKTTDRIAYFTEKADALVKKIQEESKAGNDDKVTKAQKELEKVRAELEQKEQLRIEAIEARERVEQEFKGKMVAYKMNERLGKIEEGLPWSDAADELKRLGLKTKIAQSYQPAFDEKEEELLVKTADGNYLTKSGQFVKWDALLKEEATKANLLKQNGSTGQTGQQQQRQQQNGNNGQNSSGGQGVALNSRAFPIPGLNGN